MSVQRQISSFWPDEFLAHDEVRMHWPDSRALQPQAAARATHLWSAEGDHSGAAGALREAIGLTIVTGQRDLILRALLQGRCLEASNDR